MNKELKQKLIALQNDMNAHGYSDGVEKLNSIFPELQENESGKIKKAITAIVNDWWDKAYCNHTCDIPREQMLNWISEQGTQESYTHRKTQEYLNGYKRVQEYEDLTEWEKMFDDIACSYANRKDNEGYNASWYVKDRAGEMLYHAKQEIERQNKERQKEKQGEQKLSNDFQDFSHNIRMIACLLTNWKDEPSRLYNGKILVDKDAAELLIKTAKNLQ